MYRVVALGMMVLSTAAWAVETVRISMGEVTTPITLTGRALVVGRDLDDSAYVALPSDRALVEWGGEGLVLNGVVIPEDNVRLRAGGADEADSMPGREVVTVSTGAHVRGDVVVRVNRGRLQLINVIPLEEYLLAVLGSEMPPAFPMEALKAQAVAARTYALSKKLEAFNQPFHLGSSVLHQVYGGVRSETSRTREAVILTRGEVLTYQLAPIEAYFSASCGGRTETGQDALSRDLPYLKSVSCPCSKLPASRWRITLPWSDVGSANHEVAILSRSSTGRARALRLGPARIVDAVRFRQRIGYNRLKSLDFDIEESTAGLQIQGRGYGHGAGLCQWGAKALADEGWSYQRILAHYYEGAELQHLY